MTHVKTKISLNSEDAFIAAAKGVYVCTSMYAHIKGAFLFFSTAVKQAAVRQHCN